MKDRDLDVYIDGRACGRLSQTSTGNLTFTYDEAYRQDEDATPLSLSMPLAAAVHKKRAVLPYLQGLLPDSKTALSAIARRYTVSPNNPFALLEHIGPDAAGAVQIVPRGAGATDAVRSRNQVRRVSHAEVAAMLSQIVAEYTSGAPHDDAVGRFSLAGAQPKIALHQLPDGSWSVPEDATPTTHILKPVVGTFHRIDVVEQLTLRAAASLGYQVAASELVRIGDWDVFVTQRYDRVRNGDDWRRLHQEDLCQALAISPDRKYQQYDGGPGVATIAQLFREIPAAADRSPTAHAFYGALVFNVISGCTDAHAKNYSLILEGRSVRLAPLYDLLTYAGYWDGLARLNAAMSIGKEYALRRISAGDLTDAGSTLGIPRALAAEIVQTTRQGVLPAFEEAAATLSNYDQTLRSSTEAVLAGLRKLPLVIS